VSTRGGRAILYVVLDGLGDEPCAVLGGQTPLQAASTPTLDALARQGATFRLDMRDGRGQVSTNYGQFSLLGYGDDAALPQRGPVEAAGVGLDLRPGDVAFRANYATVDAAGRIVDRRAGRIREGAGELSRALDGMDLGDGVTTLVRSGTEHRVAVVLRGPGLGAGVTDSDPVHTIRGPTAPLPIRPVDASDRAAAKTAAALEVFQRRIGPVLAAHPVNQSRAARSLPVANALIFRRAGNHLPVPSLRDRFGLGCLAVAGGSTVRGVMRLLGCTVVHEDRYTGNADTDVASKLERAMAGLRSGYDLAVAHIKAIDILSHDRRPADAAAFLERVDTALGEVLHGAERSLVVAVAADHSTSSETGDHTDVPPPALIFGEGIRPDAARAFHEAELERIGAPVLRGSAFFRTLLESAGWARSGQAPQGC
jgi:2,3-bisphosphoglycerate-independent phosphoglycerate mutase